MSDTPKSLISKLAEAMNEVGRIPKNGRNDFHKYDYVTEADLVEAIRGKLAEKKVFLFTSVEATAHAGEITEVFTLHTFVDGESGEQFQVKGYGQGQDKGDKGGYKAQTGAMKYALMKNFLVATGDDPEQTPPAPPKQQAKAPAKPAEKKLPTTIQIMETMNKMDHLQPLTVAYQKAFTYTHWTPEEAKTLGECFLNRHAKLANWIRDGFTMLGATGDVLARAFADPQTFKLTVKEVLPVPATESAEANSQEGTAEPAKAETSGPAA